MQSQSLRAWKLAPTTSHRVPSMTWMPTWQHFLRVGVRTCVESRVEQKAWPNSQHKSWDFLARKSRLDLIGYKPYSNDLLRLKKLGLRLHVGTCWHHWDLRLETPCESSLRKVHHKPIEPTCLKHRRMRLGTLVPLYAKLRPKTFMNS